MTPEEKERRAEEAKRLLHHEPLLQEAFQAVESAHIEAMLAATNDEDRRIHAGKANAARELKQELQTIIELGTQAARGSVPVA